jgi:hypothetical protein
MASPLDRQTRPPTRSAETDSNRAATIVASTSDRAAAAFAFARALGVAPEASRRQPSWALNALWLLLGIAFAAVVFGLLTYIGRHWRP